MYYEGTQVLMKHCTKQIEIEGEKESDLQQR